jgi:hypothetical protein
MTGPQHYLRAERLLRVASECVTGSDDERYHLAAAQVHAALAQAAATAIAHADKTMPVVDADAWHQVASAFEED